MCVPYHLKSSCKSIDATSGVHFELMTHRTQDIWRHSPSKHEPTGTYFLPSLGSEDNMIIENKNGTNCSMYLFNVIDNIYNVNLLYMPRHERNRASKLNSKQIKLTWRPGKYSKNNIHQKPEYIYIKMRLFIITRNGRILTIMKLPSSHVSRKPT